MSEAEKAPDTESGEAVPPSPPSPSSSPSPSRAPALRRNLGRWRGIAVAVCLVIGGAIYLRATGPRLAEQASRARPAGAFAAPGEAHRWGTDHEGREMFARVLVAAGGTAGVAGVVWVVSAVAGALLGLTRCAVRDWVLRPAAVAMRSWFCFPMFVLVAALVPVCGMRNWCGIAILCIAGTIMTGRRVAGTLSKTMGHASDRAALACAIPRLRLWLHSRLPHACFAGYRGAWAVLPLAILWEASLGFISAEAAVQPLGLGHLVRDGHLYYLDAPWLVLIPGAALAALVFFARVCEAAIGEQFDRYYSVLSDDE